MDSKAGRLGSREVDPAAPVVDKKEREVQCFTMDKVGKVTDLVEQSDRKENG
jgi:hypothetical protein